MRIRRILVLASAIAALCLVVVSTALAAGTSVSVRVEGLKRTLLPAKVVQTHGGSSVTKGGTPAGTCPSTSAAGAFNTATKGRWNGSYSSGIGTEINSILGETHTYTPNGYYWGIWVDNKFATQGICDLKLHRGEQLLFAPAPAKGFVYPIVLTAPHGATAGRSFQVKASYYNAKGARKPLAGATFKGISGKTNQQGVVSVTAQKKGKLSLTASAKGYIRSAATTVTIKA
jgi:hypothetical protein